MLARCDLVCVFSAKDERLLRSMGLKAPVQVLQPWFTVPEPRTLPGNRTVVMTAAFGRPENVDAATWLLDEIWPRVRAAVPDAHLVLAGADPPGPLVDRAGDDVTWTGFLPALDDAYRQADVFVLPLRLGAGVKFRLPQAMAHGLPVVTTSTGAEGVLTDEEATAVGAVTDDASTFAAAVIALLVDPTRAREAGAAARRLVTARFQPAGNWTALRRRYSTLVGGA